LLNRYRSMKPDQEVAMSHAKAHVFPEIAPQVVERSVAPALTIRLELPFVLGAGVTWALWTLPTDLAFDARIALIVTALALIGWVGTRLPESLVALAAAMALVLTGAVPEERLYAALGSDLVWLLLAAFIIAAVLKEAGLAERLVAPLTAARPRFAVFAFVLAAAVALTAFLLPSTSGRAALLLPVFLVLLPLLPDARLGKALSLLFPTVILLSAGGSLIGAGAHLVAVEAIAATGGPRLGYLDWLLLGAPLAAVSSLVAVTLILALFVPRTLWRARMAQAEAAGPMTVQQKRIVVVVTALVGLWLTESLHGFGMALVAVMGALVLLTKPFNSRKAKDVFRAVDMELILYMAATMLIAQAITQSGADRWLAAQAMASLPQAALTHGPSMVIAMSVIALISHLVIASRSARAAVLIPAVALPMAGLGHDATLMILIAVMGTGFCQTMMASAKPVAIFGAREEAGFTQRDLFRLALPLGLAKLVLLVGFALYVWAGQTKTTPSPLPPPTLTSDMRGALAAGPVLQTSEPPIILTSSLFPRARPADFPRVPATATPVLRTRAIAPAGLTRFERDMRTAGQQIRRDLRRLFN
jgi:solute carrier family 13 (sodium-dependent dicarboxylate transporter), member 2/3/5